MRIGSWLLAVAPAAETPWQFASLLAIRASLALFVAVLASEAIGRKRSAQPVAAIWLLGAELAVWHSMGALLTFHNGSQEQAFQSTAAQTQDLLGIAFGAGLYVNYAFLAVWTFDAVLAAFASERHRRLPPLYHGLSLGFLCFIAFNATVVFKSGWLRWFGIGATIVLLVLVLGKRLSLRFGQERKDEQGN
ncbi:hypothetical protein SH467x_002231 [Pirellulaceae bacterium SH467]